VPHFVALIFYFHILIIYIRGVCSYLIGGCSMPTFEELWNKYGISEVFARQLSEDRERIEQYEKYLGDEEPEWKYLFTTPHAVNFAVKAGWGLREAIRELIQNALDATEDVKKVRLDVIEDLYTLFVIENPSEKILFDRDITFGASEKECYKRGAFGRGLKECASVILTQGGTLYIISHDIAYRFVPVFTHGKWFLGVLLGEPKKPLWNKTRVIVYSPRGSRDVYEEIIDIILFKPRKFERCWMFDFDYTCTTVKKVNEEEIRKTVTVPIKVGIGYGGIEPSLFVRDLYVNTMYNVFGRDAIFSYNTPNIELEESRRNVANRESALKMLVEMYITLGFDYPKILDQIYDIVIGERTRRVANLVFIKLKDFVESEIFSRKPFSNGLLMKVVKHYSLDPKNTGIAHEKLMFFYRPLIEHFAFNVVVTDVDLPNDVLKPLSKLIDEASKKDYEELKKLRIDTRKIDEGIMRRLYHANIDPRVIFQIASLYKLLKDLLWPEREEYFKLYDTETYVSLGETKYSAGMTHKNEVYLQYQSVFDEEGKPDPKKMIEIILHEYAHIGSGHAEDNTEAFVKTLQDMASIVIYKLADPSVFLSLVFSLSGYYLDSDSAIMKHPMTRAYSYCHDTVLEELNFKDYIKRANCEDVKVRYLWASQDEVLEIIDRLLSGAEVSRGSMEYTTPDGYLISKVFNRIIDHYRSSFPKKLALPIVLNVFAHKELLPGTIRGYYIVLQVEPSVEYYIDIEKLKKDMREILERILSYDSVDIVCAHIYNPYTNKFIELVGNSTERKVVEREVDSV